MLSTNAYAQDPRTVHFSPRLPRPLARNLIAASIAVMFGIGSSALSAQPARGGGPQTSESARAAAADHATQLGNGLLRSMKALDRAAARERPQRTREVAQAAAERRQAMAALVEVDPKRALSLAMPAALRDKLPPEAKALVEETVQAEGVIVGMLIDDLEQGTSKHPLFLETDTPGAHGRSAHDRFGLHWADDSLSEETMMGLINRRVHVKALRVDGKLVIGSRDDMAMASVDTKGNNGKGNGSNKDKSKDGGSGSGATTVEQAAPTSPTSPMISGDQHTLVIATNFSDRALSCSTSSLQTRLYGASGSVDQILRQSSRDAVSISGDVVGPFTIPYSASASCDYNAWGAAADAAARAAGIDLSRYARISYATPPNGNCGWSGIANLGGTPPTRSWVTSCGTTGLFAHEISHNLRFHHATTPGVEYGDYSDPMGYVQTVQMNAPNRVMAGWLPASSILDAAGSGTYMIASLAGPDTGAAQVIRLGKPDTGEFYYLSLRQSEGLDANLQAAYKNVISVHRASGTLPSKTVLMARLASGQSYADAANGIRVTTQSVTTGAATVSVDIAGAVCSRAAPTIGLAPASQTGAPGATLRYTLSITNRNSSTCGAASFALGQTVPTGFAASFSANTVSLAPGASTNVNWSVASVSTIGDGVYSLKASAGESGSAAASAAASYVVYSDGTPPSVSISYPTDGAVIPAKPASLTATAFDADGIARVDFFVDGSLVGSSGSAPYQVRWNAKKAKGSQTLTVRAVDKAGNEAEASSRFTVK